MPEYSIDEIQEKSVALLGDHGVNVADAHLLVDHMLTADKRGKPSHGLGVRLAMILQQAEEGRGRPTLEVRRDNGHSVALDGHNGFGYVQGKKALDMLTERVREHGLSAVALGNTGHTGMLGYYAARGAEAGVVTLAFGNCCPLMAPFGGARALLGTNPLAFGFPAAPHPIIVDMGTAAITVGERINRKQSGRNLPPGCALGPDGEPTTDPCIAEKGCLLPFGGHRGGALAIAVQLLAGALTGSAAIPPKGKGYGLLLIGIAPALFANGENYEDQIADFIDNYLNIPPQKGSEVRLPGAKGYELLRETEKRGTLSLPPETAEMIGLEM